MENIATIEDSDQGSQISCFRAWMNLQEEDLLELHQALNLNADGGDHTLELKQLAEKNIMHFEEYVTKRLILARDDVSSYFSPAWCSSLEGSMLWAGGCRPSSYIRLLYALSGNDLELNLEEYLRGRGITNGGLGEISANQIQLVHRLQMRTVKQEDKLSSKLASLQEDIADMPIATIAQESRAREGPNREVNEALEKHAESMLNVLEEADNLRLITVKELVNILTPIQAIGFLAAAKKLLLCVHEWGKIRDHEHGRVVL